MARALVIVLIFHLSALSLVSSTKFVLLGSLGDLSRKYLWTALHTNLQGADNNIQVYGASRDKPSQGHAKLSEILNKIPDIRDNFLSRVQYLQLKTGEHFETFCGDFNEELLIFYLSIPPSAYIPTSKFIAKYCKREGLTVRIAYEKPFGYDSRSAEELFSNLETLFDSKQIYLIDHYLGKSITQKIISLRKSNHELESVLNSDHVAKIEVKLLETLDCEGRAGYYDTSGVMRDMLQNHATELLTLVTCDLTDNLLAAKVKLLESLVQPNKHQVVVGQYELYKSHVGENSVTPTFASVLFTSISPRWKGVPIIMSSGKSQTNEKKQILVTFKSGETLDINFKPASITFNGKHLLESDFTAHSNSYIALIRTVLDGKKDLLPSVDTVRISWRLWDHIIKISRDPILHENRQNMEVHQVGHFLMAANRENIQTSSHMKFFNKAFLISDHEERLCEHLVDDIIRASENVEGDFHIALSGGNTILGVFKYLLVASDEIRWDKVHIWQVDERCNLTHSNAKILQNYLLDHIPIPEDNIHLMPCSEIGCKDPSEYQHIFESMNIREQFDYVVLGLGSDGHTASLFHNSTTIIPGKYFKTVEVLQNRIVSPHRMTSTFDLLNKSGRIAILVTGSEKRWIVQSIKSGLQYPVSNVRNDNLTWFIEDILL